MPLPMEGTAKLFVRVVAIQEVTAPAPLVDALDEVIGVRAYPRRHPLEFRFASSKRVGPPRSTRARPNPVGREAPVTKREAIGVRARTTRGRTHRPIRPDLNAHLDPLLPTLRRLVMRRARRRRRRTQIRVVKTQTAAY